MLKDAKKRARQIKNSITFPKQRREKTFAELMENLKKWIISKSVSIFIKIDDVSTGRIQSQDTRHTHTHTNRVSVYYYLFVFFFILILHVDGMDEKTIIILINLIE